MKLDLNNIKPGDLSYSSAIKSLEADSKPTELEKLVDKCIEAHCKGLTPVLTDGENEIRIKRHEAI